MQSSITSDDQLADKILNQFEGHTNAMQVDQIVEKLNHDSDNSQVIRMVLKDLEDQKYLSDHGNLAGYYICTSSGRRVIRDGGWLNEVKKIEREKDMQVSHFETQYKLGQEQLKSVVSSRIRSNWALVIAAASLLWQFVNFFLNSIKQ